jgi:hypothetical protein
LPVFFRAKPFSAQQITRGPRGLNFGFLYFYDEGMLLISLFKKTNSGR